MALFDEGDLLFKSWENVDAYEDNMGGEAGSLDAWGDINVGRVGGGPVDLKHVCVGGGDGPNEGGRGRSWAAAAETTSY